MDYLKKLNLQSLGRAFERRATLPSAANPPIASPSRDWHIILICAALALAAVVVAASAFYWLERTNNAPAMGGAAPGSIGISGTTLNATLAHYQTLDAEHAALLAHGSAVADPAAAQ